MIAPINHDDVNVLRNYLEMHPQCEIHAIVTRALSTLEATWVKLAAWESNGLTEEMLREHDGYLKIDRGIVMISEHYLEELQRERDALIQKCEKMKMI